MSNTERLASTGIIAVLRAPSADLAIKAVDALVAGGVTGIEVTYSTPDTPTVITEVRRRHGDTVFLGAGTVLTAAHAEEAVAAGAQFLVSPGTSASLAKAMAATGVDIMLGALTPSELMLAVELGAAAVKIFPASLGGPAYLKSLRGPFPDVPLMPTGGVNAGNLREWLDAGAVAVGAGSELCAASLMIEGRWSDLESRARLFSAALAEAREQ